jgi:ectoine hydroxylase-related dioxygenase (phytanoyl-CoA dioxygenase family)
LRAARQPNLDERLASLRLTGNAEDLVEKGYTVLEGPAPPEFFDRLRARIVECVVEVDAPVQTGMLLARGRVFEEAACNPRVLALAELMCGKGFILSQMVGTVRPQGDYGLPIHTDYDLIRDPFPPHTQTLTAVWACDDFTREGGCTWVVPGSHHLRRHPRGRELADDAVALECPRGSILVWDGATWHGSYARIVAGERVALHVMFNRMALRPFEAYDLTRETIERNPPELASLLGLNDPFGKSTVLGIDLDRYKWAERRFRS